MNRNLRFKNLNDAVNELQRLDKGKVVTAKLWSYYQILNHCADSLEFSMSSYPRVMPSFIRKTIGKFFFKKLMKDGYMKPGSPNPGAPKKREEGDVVSALKRLRNSISIFTKYEGPFGIHPIFDELTKSEWEKLHTFHIANHLGFADIDENENYSLKTTSPKKSAPKKKGKTIVKSKKKTTLKKKKGR